MKFSADKTSIQLVCEGTQAGACVKVSDSGPGIAPENVARLFERFTRGLHRGTADPGGAGLALAFVRVVMVKHGGQVGVENTQQQGATFYVSLPVVAATESRE